MSTRAAVIAVERAWPLRLLDVTLNVYAILLVVLVVTGGYIPDLEYQAHRTLFQLVLVGHWVFGFLVLLALRLWAGRAGRMGPPACLRWLRASGEYVAHRPAVVYVATAGWAILLIAIAIRRHLAFESGVDLAIFDQALWNTSRGDFLHSSLIAQSGPSVGDRVFFADHLVPLHLVLVPFYWLAPSPVIPLVAQSLMLALGAVPLYWLARDRFPGQALAAVFPLAYLCYQPLREPSRYDYHAAVLVPPLFLFALYFMEKARWGWMILFLVLAGLVKENLPIAGVTIGLYVFFARRQRRLGLALVGVFGLWLYAGLAWVIPAFNDGEYRHLYRYAAFGHGTLSETLGGLVRDPLPIVQGLFALAGRKLRYLIELFGPVAFVPLLAPGRLALGLPFLAQNLFADSWAQTSIYSHYSVELIAFVFFAAVEGTARVQRWVSARVFAGDAARSYRWLVGALLAASFLFHGWSEMFYLRWYSPPPNRDALHAVLAAVPAGAAVSALPRLTSHLAERKTLYVFPKIGEGDVPVADYVVVDRRLVGHSRLYAVDRLELARFDPELAALPGKGYEKIVDRDGIMVFRRYPLSRFGQLSDVPVVGDWTGTGWPKHGVFRQGAWYLDLNGNDRWDGCRIDRCLNYGEPGNTPVVGDWMGIGRTSIGIFQDGHWILDINGNGEWDSCDVDLCLVFGRPGDVPVVGDWTGTGQTRIGVFRGGAWFLDLNGNGQWDGCEVDRCVNAGPGADHSPFDAW